MPRTLFPSGLFGNNIASLMFCDPRILKWVFPTNKDILLAELAGFRARAGKRQDKTGKSGGRKQRSTQE